MFTIKHNIPEIRDKLERIKKLMTGPRSYRRDILNQLDWARKNLVRTTPKSDGSGSQVGGKHLNSGWAVHTIGGKAKSRAPVLGVVYNKFVNDAAGRVKESAWLSSKRDRASVEATILHVLEYGSRPHTIRPVDARALRFDAGGRIVFTKLVHHPGTKPHGMIRVTRSKFTRRMRKLAVRWAQRMAEEWRRG